MNTRIYVADKATQDAIKTEVDDMAANGAGIATVIITTKNSALYGEEVTLSSEYATYTGTLSDEGQAIIKVKYLGLYTAKANGIVIGTKKVDQLGGVFHLNSFYHYAFHCSSSIADPAAKITPVEGTDNYNFKNVQMNFATGVIDGGDWFDVDANGVISGAPMFFPRSCMLKYDGTVDYYLDENDETKKENGGASDVANSAYGGNAMMEWGQNGQIIYMKVVPDGDDTKSGTYHFSNEKLDAGYKDYAFRDCNGDLAAHFYTAKYFGSHDGTRMRSLSGGTNYVSHTAADEITAARANNAGANVLWDTLTLSQWMLINGLLILMAGSTNTQQVYGYGRCLSTNTAAIGQGTMDGKGMFFGKSDQTSGVKVFGMENWWGNIWRRLRGYINASGTIKIKMTKSTVDGSTATDYNTDGTGYIELSGATMAGTNGGFISEMLFTEYGMFPIKMSGSATTHYTDGGWFNNGQTDYACVGGGWNSSDRVGALCVDLSSLASGSNTALGSALSCTPLAAAA